MELTESIESLNRQLKDLYGMDTLSGLSIWRIVWSEDQLEKRLMHVTPNGIQLTNPKVMEVKKYFDFTKDRYVLEQLVLVTGMNAEMLPSQNISYEPMYVFEHGKLQTYLPPRLDIAQAIIDTVNTAKGKGNMKKYFDPDADVGEALENKKKRIDNILEQISGDESGLGGAIVHGEGVGYGVKH